MNIKSLLIGSAAALACVFAASASNADPGAGGGCAIPNQSVWHQAKAPIKMCLTSAVPLMCVPMTPDLIATADPFPGSPAIGVNETLTGPQLAEGAGRLGKHPILPWQFAESWGGILEGDGGMKKPNLLGPQLALADKPGLVTITAKTTSI